MARKALAETLTSSAVGKSVTTIGTPAASSGAYACRSMRSACSDRTPITRRSGRRVSSMANPSRRNSGFHASSAPAPTGASPLIRSPSRAAVPTGTVDLPTTRHSPGQQRRQVVGGGVDVPQVGRELARLLRGADTDEVHVAELGHLGVRRGEAQLAGRRGASAAAPRGPARRTAPARRRARRPSRRRRPCPRTSNPSSAMQAAWVAPRYPVPTTVMRSDNAVFLSCCARGRYRSPSWRPRRWYRPERNRGPAGARAAVPRRPRSGRCDGLSDRRSRKQPARGNRGGECNPEHTRVPLMWLKGR